MEAGTVMRRGTTGAIAMAGRFGPPADDRAVALTAAVAPDGPCVTALRSGRLVAAAAGRTDGALARTEGCLIAVDGALYDLDVLLRKLGLPVDLTVEQALARAYRHLGTSLLELLRGDFALLVWDEAAGTGLVARDQLGGRALFLHERGDELLFASELRNLLRLVPRRPAPDPVAMVHWLSMGGPPGDRTFYEGVRQLPAGHCVELDARGWRVVRYWRPAYRRPERVSFQDAAERVRAALERAVERRSPAGEVTGLMLSGGIDSAAVAGVAAACGRQPASAYSAVFPQHPQVDESRLIELLSAELGLPTFALPVLGGSVLDGAVDYLREWEVPASSPNLFFWNVLLRRAADDGVTMMLDGEGGDALFWFAPYLLADRLLHARLASAVALARRFPIADGPMPARTVLWLLRTWGLRGAFPYGLHRLRQRARGPAAFAPRWFTDASAQLRFETDPELAWKRSHAPRWWSAQVDAVTGVGSSLVHDAARRRNAMAGIAATHPLLDVDLIELVLSLPPELAFDPDVSRPLLRESVRGLIPEQVRLRRSKSSFDALFHASLAGLDLPAVRALLLTPDAEVNAYVQPATVRAELFEHGPPRTPGALRAWALGVWRLVTAETWLRRQAGRPPLPEATS